MQKTCRGTAGLLAVCASVLLSGGLAQAETVTETFKPEVGAVSLSEYGKENAPSGTVNLETGVVTDGFTVPAGVTELHVTAIGGEGEGSSYAGEWEDQQNRYDSQGGLGAEVSSSVQVQPGQSLSLEFVPGGAGARPTTISTGGETVYEPGLFCSELANYAPQEHGYGEGSGFVTLETMVPEREKQNALDELASREQQFRREVEGENADLHPCLEYSWAGYTIERKIALENEHQLNGQGGAGGSAAVLSSGGRTLLVAGGGGGAGGAGGNGGNAGASPERGQGYTLDDFVHEENKLYTIEGGEAGSLTAPGLPGAWQQERAPGWYSCMGDPGEDEHGGRGVVKKVPISTGWNIYCAAGGGGGAGVEGGGAGAGTGEEINSQSTGSSGGGAGSSVIDGTDATGTISTAGRHAAEEIEISYERTAAKHATRTTLACPPVVEADGQDIGCRANVEDTVTHEQVSAAVEDVWEVSTDCADHLPTATEGSAPGSFEWSPHEPGVRTAYARFSGNGTEEPSISSCVKVFYADPPSIGIASPSAGETFYEGEEPRVEFSCKEGYGSELALAGCEGSQVAGSKLDLTKAGNFEFKVNAEGGDRLHASAAVKYTVLPKHATKTTLTCPPVVESNGQNIACQVGVEDTVTHEQLSVPVEDVWEVSTDCADHLPTGTQGSAPGAFEWNPHEPGVRTAYARFAGSRTEQPSSSSCVKVSYAEPPAITITAPYPNEVLAEGEEPEVRFSCQEGYGSEDAIAACEGTQADGSKLSSKAGPGTFSVTAIGGDGLVSVKTVSYEVKPKPATCSKVSGTGTYEKKNQSGRLYLREHLSTTLSSHQQLGIHYQTGANRFRLKKLTEATCYVYGSEKVFSGKGLTSHGETIAFSITQTSGGFFFKATIESEIEGGPLKSASEKFE